jgi:hypothetical protein
MDRKDAPKKIRGRSEKLIHLLVLLSKLRTELQEVFVVKLQNFEIILVLKPNFS